jgi:hypothetical protein
MDDYKWFVIFIAIFVGATAAESAYKDHNKTQLEIARLNAEAAKAKNEK